MLLFSFSASSLISCSLCKRASSKVSLSLCLFLFTQADWEVVGDIYGEGVEGDLTIKVEVEDWDGAVTGAGSAASL